MIKFEAPCDRAIAATGWQPQRNARTTLTEIYNWIIWLLCVLSGIFVQILLACARQ